MGSVYQTEDDNIAVQFVPFILLALLFAACAIANADIVLGVSSGMKKARAAGRNVSMIPFVGGLAGAAACIVAPFDGIRAYFWVPIILDAGTGFYLAAMLLLVVTQALGERTTDKPAAVEESAELRKMQHAMKGCILGTACGDSIGLPMEGLSKRRLRKLFPDLDGHRLLMGRGLTSDDTEHTCMLAQAIIVSHSHPDAFARDFAWRLRFWFLRLPPGIGKATLRACLKLWMGFSPNSSGVRSAGNGPAMRSALLGVCFGDDPPILRKFVRAATRITHTDKTAEFGAMAVAVAAHCSSRGEILPSQYLKRLEPLIEDGEAFLAAVRNVAESVEKGETTEEFVRRSGCERGVSGYILHTVPAAVHAWLRHPDDFRAGVLEIVRCGGDTDTCAAIVGAIIGSRVGKEGIPEDWLLNIIEWPCTVAWMERLSAELAGSVHAARHGLPPTTSDPSVLRVGGTVIFVRNLLFLGIVLVHGIRRMLPPY